MTPDEADLVLTCFAQGELLRMRLASASVQWLETLVFQTSVAQNATAHAITGKPARQMIFICIG
jgi:hypothetical protein